MRRLSSRSYFQPVAACAGRGDAISEGRIEREQAALMWFGVAYQCSNFLVVKQSIRERPGGKKSMLYQYRSCSSSPYVRTLARLLIWPTG